jgi:hypothetical protein
MMSVPVAATAISFSLGSLSVSAHRHHVDDGDVGVLEPLDDLRPASRSTDILYSCAENPDGGPWCQPTPDRETRSFCCLNLAP